MDLSWLESHLIPCPFKSLTGFDCPGCGFQRSSLFLLRGDLIKSIEIFPALIPFLITIVFMIVHLRMKMKNGTRILMTMYSVSLGILLVNYIIKEIFFFTAR
ncbi:MAG TPA: DUF2752 domain-containing protein [Bacteroidia bacterium]|jgi:hypothetical protein|nr:DUF2752 domain-containing protein [Bacteroidia bacterium]